MYDLETLAYALSELGIESVDVQGDEIYACCPGHVENLGRKDTNPSWHMNDEGVHNCWSCHYSGNLVTLVIELLDLTTQWHLPDYAAAEAWIEEHVGDYLTGAADRLARDPLWIPLPKPVPMTEARLAVFEEPPNAALRPRGISREIAAKYQILWQRTNGWWITPLRHPISHALMGWQEKGQWTRYFKNRPPTMKKSSTFFGWAQAMETPGTVVVVESPLDVGRIASVMGFGWAVATCGAKVSKKQMGLMREFDFVIWAFDQDEAGRSANQLMLDNKMRGAFFNYGTSGAKDPGEMTDSEIRWGIDNAIDSVWGEKAFLH